MLSIVRTVTIVLADTVTVTGWGGGGGAGAAAGATAVVIGSAAGLAGEVAAARRDFFRVMGVFRSRWALRRSASRAGVAGCGTVICASGDAHLIIHPAHALGFRRNLVSASLAASSGTWRSALPLRDC